MPKTIWSKINKDWLYNEYINNKKSTRRIAKEIKVSQSTVYRALVRYNIPRRSDGQPRKNIKENFYSKIKILPNSCWEWQAKIHNPTGYGHFTIRENFLPKTYLAHRYSYEIHKDKIPEGMTIDHLCRNRKCVNPEHLEVISLRKNILRGISPSAQNARKTHCIREHLLSGTNLYITPDGRRQCRMCRTLPQIKREVCYP